MPYVVVVGDLNGEPEHFSSLRDQMGAGSLHDIRAMEVRAGSSLLKETCFFSANEPGTRRDLILASTRALDTCINFEVEEESLFATHKLIKRTMRTGDLKTGARRKLPVMDTDHMLPKSEKGKLDIDRIQRAVDEQVQGCELELTEALRQRGPTVLWKLLSQAAEQRGTQPVGRPDGQESGSRKRKAQNRPV